MTFKLLGEDLDPVVLTQAIGVTPTESGRKGDPIVAHLSRGMTASRPAVLGYWCYTEVAKSLVDVEAVLRRLLDRLFHTGSAHHLRPDLVRALNGQIVVHGAGPGTTVDTFLSDDVRRRLSELGLDVYVNAD